MKKYEYLEHTADAKFKAYGKTLGEAFANAALATFAIICKPEQVKPEIEHKIELNGKKKMSLLYDFLEELLFLLDTEGFVLHEVINIQISEDLKLEATVTGDSYKNYDVSGNVKSVTYNDMEIKEEPDQVMVQVVVDL